MSEESEELSVSTADLKDQVKEIVGCLAPDLVRRLLSQVNQEQAFKATLDLINQASAVSEFAGTYSSVIEKLVILLNDGTTIQNSRFADAIIELVTPYVRNLFNTTNFSS